jgi:hypothetical protein
MTDHLSREAIVDWLSGGMADAEGAALEEHLFDCDACSLVATRLEEVAAGVRDLVASGKTGAIATDALLAKLEANGVGLRHYSVEPDGVVECSVGRDDVFIVAHYNADFTGVERITIVATKENGVVLRRMEDVPVAPGARAVHVLLRGDFLRKMPSGTHTVTLSSGERILARYTFSHAGFSGGP